MAQLVEKIGSVSLVRQGEHRFFSLTMPSDLLAETTFVVSREENPEDGFQRLLDPKRAQEIADYIDNGLGTIPSSIVLSAQPDAELTYDNRLKTIKFNRIPKAFMIIDGQHRVYGFKLAKTALRIPVVIYHSLSRRDETRLFIDVNSKQKGVPPELLLDIKKLAEYENSQEEMLREIYDLFNSEPDSHLKGRLSPSSRSKGMLTRATFNGAVKPLLNLFQGKIPDEIYHIMNNYLYAFENLVLKKAKMDGFLVTANGFKATTNFFSVAASKVKDRYGAIYSADHFGSCLSPMASRIKAGKIQAFGNSYIRISEHFEEILKTSFTV